MAAVATGSLTGIVRVQQNALTSNALGFKVTTTGSNANMTLAPVVLNMAVGDTQTLQALSSTGQTVTGLTWSSSDNTIASLSTDDPPVLTALAAGHVTTTAGTASADVTVWSGVLPLGTVLWSNPGNGSSVTKIVPAVPSATGVADVFAFQADDTVQAITSDGQVAWTANAGPVVENNGWILPDFQGGLVIDTWDGSAETIKRFDGLTGQLVFQYVVSSNDSTWSPVVHTDGTIFVMIATDDGGVIGWKGTIYDQSGTPIGTSPLKDYMTFDQNGNLTGQEAVVQSWTLNTFMSGGAAQRLQFKPVTAAYMYTAFIQGSSSHSGAASSPHSSPHDALYTLSEDKKNNLSQPMCDAALAQFANIAGISKGTLVAQLKKTAQAAKDHVYEGPHSEVELTADKFPTTATSTIKKVGQWFAFYSDPILPGYADALSQYNGAALFIRYDDWRGRFLSKFNYFLIGKVNSFGIGAMMHEIMHKSMVGGGFTHNDPPDARDMRAVLEAAGATPNNDTNERNVVSYEFAQICFNTY